jgi:hypothetical protein
LLSIQTPYKGNCKCEEENSPRNKPTKRHNKSNSEVFEFDSLGLGNEFKMSRYDISGAMTDYRTKEYDERGRLTRQIKYSKGGEVQGYTTYEYDVLDRKITVASFGETGRMENK